MSGSANLEIKDNQLTISVNPKLYPLEAVYSAAYVFMDRAYIVLDGDPKKEILVRMKLKSEGSLEELGDEFNNEMLNYADYLSRAKGTKKMREMLLQRAIIANDSNIIKTETDDCIDLGDLEDLEDEDFLDDPEGIAIPWEEKYGDKADKESEEKNENKAEQ